MTLSFSSPRALDAARCAVLDLFGRRVATLWDGPLGAGRREWLWDGRDDAGSPVPPGVYVALAEAGTTRLTRRLVLVR
jgi:flagellar hook assembly protein FlgD